MKGLAATFILFLLIAGHEPPVLLHDQNPAKDTIVAVVPQAVVIPVPDTIITKIKKEEPAVQTGTVSPYAVVKFAKTLIGTRYLYGSTDPKKGFDCSGFITYVFNHFKIKVPRSSVEFTDVGEEVNYYASKPGDLILFTGTDSTIRVVGHMGIVVSNENNKLSFIHSTSGKQYGVTVTELSPYYLSRFVRVARVFPNNESETSVEHTEVGLNAEPSIKTNNKTPGTKKTSSLTSSKKIDSSKTVKSKSKVNSKPTVKKSTTKKTPVTKKTSVAKKKIVKKPVSTVKKSTTTTTPTKKITPTEKTTQPKKTTTTKKVAQPKKTISTQKITQPKETTSKNKTTQLKESVPGKKPVKKLTSSQTSTKA